MVLSDGPMTGSEILYPLQYPAWAWLSAMDTHTSALTRSKKTPGRVSEESFLFLCLLYRPTGGRRDVLGVQESRKTIWTTYVIVIA